MKNIFSILKFTFLLVILFAVIYPLAIYGMAQFSPNKGKGETITQNGRAVGYQKIGQKFNTLNYFWGRPSAVDYNGAGSGGSNKGASNETYLALVQKRIDTFLIAHPYLNKLQIPAEMVTASGSGLDPNISPQGALIQVKRVAKERKIAEEKIKELVEAQCNRPSIMGPETVNVLALNIALNELK